METDKSYRLFNEPLTNEQHDERRRLLDAVRVRITRPPLHAPEILRISGTPIASVGNISVSLGKAKSRKTFNVSAMVAALLSGKEVLKYSGQLPPDKPDILYIDTEQSYGHCYKVLDRILTLAELPKDREPEHLFVVRLREISTLPRREYIKWALEENPNFGFIVIDGLRDLVKDINSSDEAQEVLDILQGWTGTLQNHIHVVLHLNKIDDNARGHIGTEIINKGESMLLISKNTENKAVSTVRPMETRDREFDPFSFIINEDGLPELIEKAHAPKKQRMTLDNIGWENHKAILSKAFKTRKYSNQKNLILALMPLYGAIGFQRSETTMKTLVNMLVTNNVLEVTDKGGYLYHKEIIDQLISDAE